MHIQHRHARRAHLRQPFVVVQQRHLHAAAAKTLDTVASTGDDQHRVGPRITRHRHIQCQHLAVAPGHGVLIRGNGQTGASSPLQEPHTRLGVAARKRLIETDHLATTGDGCANHASASRTQ
jgi:hypothetical protein